MDRKDGLLLLVITVVLCLYLIPSAAASTEEQNNTSVKDGAQLKMEALEAELGEEGMQEVRDYLELQASLPDVVKRMPFSGLAFAGTDPESQAIKMRYIDNFDVSEKKKEEYSAGLQDIWDRYPDRITKDDYAFMSELGPMIEEEAFRGYKGKLKRTDTPQGGFAEYAYDGPSNKRYAMGLFLSVFVLPPLQVKNI